MVILKIFIMGTIIYICSYLGFTKAKIFENRVIELKKIQTSLNMFKCKIEFTYEPIKDIFNEISTVVYENNDNIFKNTVKNLENYNVSQSWYISISNTRAYLDFEDKETLKIMGKLLGKTDKQGQISEINLTENLLLKQIEKAELEKNKNSKLYKTLGTVLGIGLVIILM